MGNPLGRLVDGLLQDWRNLGRVGRELDNGEEGEMEQRKVVT